MVEQLLIRPSGSPLFAKGRRIGCRDNGSQHLLPVLLDHLIVKPPLLAQPDVVSVVSDPGVTLPRAGEFAQPLIANLNRPLADVALAFQFNHAA